MILAILGTLPFLAAATMAWLEIGFNKMRLLQAISIYAALVLAFFGGIQWGLGVSLRETAPRSAQTLFLLPLALTLPGAALLLIDSYSARLVIASALLAASWGVDALLHLQRLIPTWFFRLRCIVSPVAIASLLLLLPKA
ncbi:MAG: DUF3429 domain-containing protein [Betaproteobacteria bacterium]